MLSVWLNACIPPRRSEMDFINEPVGEGWESMTCAYADGFTVIWQVGQDIDPMIPFAEHMRVVHGMFIPDFSRWKFK